MDIQLTSNEYSYKHAKSCLSYFSRIAKVVVQKPDDDSNFLANQYNKITSINDETVLAQYLYLEKPTYERHCSFTLIFPFGLNKSQKSAVTNAFSSQVSIIEGPPGTGKTQTILSIVANVIMQGKTVAVVSNNNSATANVFEKLKSYDLSFFAAYLRNLENKETFIKSQKSYPDLNKWFI